MGTFSSKDTRRISFDNTFALNPALAVQNSIGNDDDIGLENLTQDPGAELFFNDSNKAIEIRDDGEFDYWAHRIEYLKKEHQAINKIIETEYEKTIENANKLFEPQKTTQERIQKIKPCHDWRNKILQCYEVNSHQPLMCSSLVQAFTKCVTSCRIED